MQESGGKILTGIKYVYLIVFFALLSGLFFPIIERGANANQVVIGVIILGIALAGSLSLYKTSTAEKKQKMFLIVGFAVLALALFLVFLAIGAI